MSDDAIRKPELGNPQGGNERNEVLSQLSDLQQQVYSFLKNRHIEHRDYRVKEISIFKLGKRLDLENCEEVVAQLVDEGLAVRRGNDVMWMPKISNELQTTLNKIRHNDPVEEDERARCLIEMGLVSSEDTGGYRYRWEEKEAIENGENGASDRSFTIDQQTPTVRAEIGVVLPKNCPVAETSTTVDTPIENVSRAVAPTQHGTVSEEFTLDSEVSPGHPDLSEITSGVYRFSRDPGQDCVCDWIERFGCPVTDIRAHDGTLIVSFTGAEPTVRDIVDELQKRFSDVHIRQLAPVK